MICVDRPQVISILYTEIFYLVASPQSLSKQVLSQVSNKQGSVPYISI
jgi:hypothetical protein